MKCSTPEAKCAKGVFQIQSPIFGVNFPFICSDHYSSYKTYPKNLPEKVCSPMQSFLMKKVPPYFVGGEDTLCFIFKSFPTSNSSYLTLVVENITFQETLPSHCF